MFAFFRRAEPRLAIGWNRQVAYRTGFGNGDVLDKALSSATKAGTLGWRRKRVSSLETVMTSKEGVTAGCFRASARH